MQNIELYAYLNIDNPIVAWEVAIGRIKSNCDRNPENIGVSIWQYSLLRYMSLNGLNNNIRNEFGLELCRQRNYAEKVSRITGVYFFESEAIARQALERWGLMRYQNYISKVYFSATQLTRYDSEWITSYISGESSDWYEGYLSGETLGVSPLTEIIASGIGSVANNKLRVQAYQKIIERWPTATPILFHAMAAFCEAGIEDAALLIPFLSLQDGDLYGEYLIYMQSFYERQVDIGEAADRLRQRGFNTPIILPDGDVFSTLPDSTEYSFKVALPDAASIYNSIHNY